MRRQTSELIAKGPHTEAGETVGVAGGFVLLESHHRPYQEAATGGHSRLWSRGTWGLKKESELGGHHTSAALLTWLHIRIASGALKVNTDAQGHRV